MRGADNSSDNDLWLSTDELEEEGIGGVEEERKESDIADIEQQRSDGYTAAAIGAGHVPVQIPMAPSPMANY